MKMEETFFRKENKRKMKENEKGIKMKRLKTWKEIEKENENEKMKKDKC